MIVFPSLSFGTISSSITALLNIFKNYNSNNQIDYFKISDISGYSSYVNTSLPYDLVGSNTGFMTVYNGPGTGGQNAFYLYIEPKPDIGLILSNASYFSWNSGQAKYIGSNSFYNSRLVCCDYKGYEYQEYFNVGYYDIGWNGSLWEMSGVVNEGGAKQSIQTYSGGTQYSVPTSFGYRGVLFTPRPNVTESNEYINFGIALRNVTKNRSATISLTQNNSEKLKFNILQSGLGINNQTITFTNNLEPSPYQQNGNEYYFDTNFYGYFTATDQPKSLRYSFTGILPFSYFSNGDVTNIGFSEFTGDNSNLTITDINSVGITRNINSFVGQNLTSSNKYFTLTGTKENTSGISLTGQYFQADNTPLNPYQNYLTGNLKALYRYPRDFVSFDFSTYTLSLNIWDSQSGVWIRASNLYGGNNGITASRKSITYPTANPVNNSNYMYRAQDSLYSASIFTPTIGTGYERLPYENVDIFNFNGFTKMYKPLTLSFSSGFSFNAPYNNLSIASWPGKQTTNYGGNRNNINQNLGIFAPYLFSNEDIRYDETIDSANIKIYLDFSVNKWVAKYTYNADTLAFISVYHGPTNTGQNPFPCVFNYVSGQYPQVSGSFEAYISSGSWTGIFTKNDPQFSGAFAFVDSSNHPVDLGFRNYWNSRGY
jgi:hypothetical protein